MLMIRKEQMDAFRVAARSAFENEMVVHLRPFAHSFPEAITEDQLRKLIHLGMTRASSYGLTFRGPVRLYLELMMLLGSHFDDDPQYPWVAEFLAGQDTDSQLQRAELLYNKTLSYQENVAGLEDVYAYVFLGNARFPSQRLLSVSSENILPAMLGEITQIHPRKAAYVGAERLKDLIHCGIEGARRHRLPNRGIFWFIVLMVVFGHGCAHDPLHPWISRILGDKDIPEPEGRVTLLEAKILSWLKQIVA